MRSEDGNQEVTKSNSLIKIKRKKEEQRRARACAKKVQSVRLLLNNVFSRPTSHSCFLTSCRSEKVAKKTMFCFANSHPPLLVDSCQGNLLTYFVVFKMFFGEVLRLQLKNGAVEANKERQDSLLSCPRQERGCA